MQTKTLQSTLLLMVALGVMSCSAGARQVNIAVADDSFEQQRAFACAEVCVSEHESGATDSLFACVRECPGLDVSESEACDRDLPHAVCAEAEARDRAAFLTIRLLRSLAHPTMRSVAMADGSLLR